MSTAARIDELRKKFEENPRRYFAPLANELRKAGDLTQAIALCREHLPKQPGHMSGYIVFGQALFESGDLDEARGVFEQALALDPENLIALHHLGHIARQQGDTLAARRWYERALETDPRNDDIAHQLAALATPVRPNVSIPTPSSVASIADSQPAPERTTAELTVPELGVIPERRDLGAIPTPPFPQVSVSDVPPTAAPFDLDAIESAGQASASSVPDVMDAEPIELSFDDIDLPPAIETASLIDLSGEAAAGGSPSLSVDDVAPQADIVPTGQVMADDPFAFADDVTEGNAIEPIELSPVDLEAHFEEGLVAEAWPDTTELMQRAGTPRSATPVSVDIPIDAVEAFGREPQDPVVAPLPEPEPDVLGPEADLVIEPIADVDESMPVIAEQEVEDVVSDADPREDLPWLAASAALPVEAEPMAIEASFSELLIDEPYQAGGDIEPEDDTESEPAEPSADAQPAFVTETMGELLVAQGFMDRAIMVYEELVRRRPYDPVLGARLAELREAQATAPAAAVPAFTARERFAALAARRVARRTPSYATPVIASTALPSTALPSTALPSTALPSTALPSTVLPTPVTATPAVPPAAIPAIPTPAPDSGAPTFTPSVPPDSLAELFGSEPTPQDDHAAQALAQAFAPEQDDAAAVTEGFPASFFGYVDSREPTAAFGSVRRPTPVRSATPLGVPAVAAPADVAPVPEAEFSFDRFFPDPAGKAPASPAAPESGATAAPDATAPATPTGANPAGASDDLAQFSAWLKGLGNS